MYLKGITIMNQWILKEHPIVIANKPIYHNYLTYKNFIIQKSQKTVVFYGQKKVNGYHQVIMANGLTGWIKGKVRPQYDFYLMNYKKSHPEIIKIINVKTLKNHWEMTIINGKKQIEVVRFDYKI